MARSHHEYRVLVLELKRVLKARRLTYKELGQELGISEAGVKRIFQKTDGKVSTLVRICEALGFSFVDLVSSSKLGTAQIQYLTPKQDEFFAKNFNHYVFFNELVIRKKSLSEIQRDHGLSARSLRKYIRTLERLGLIEEGAKGRIKFRVKEPVGFAKDGILRPMLQRSFARSVVSALTEGGAVAGNHMLLTRDWALSREHYQSFRKEIDGLIRQYDQIGARDFALLERSDLVSASVLVGVLGDRSPYPKLPEIPGL